MPLSALTRRISFLLLACVTSFPGPSFAQTTATDVVGDAVSGAVEMRGAAYTVDGIDARRPSTSAQTSATLTLDKWGFSTGINLLYTTESSDFRQSMNRLGFESQFSWGTVGAGDVTPTFTRYSLSGVTVRGGYVDISPGPITLSAIAGRAQEAIDPRDAVQQERLALRGAAYARWLYGLRFGFGREEGTHLHLISVVARDDVSSIDVDKSLLPPTENLTITPDVGVTFFEGAFNLQGSLTASFFTRDTGTEAAEQVPLSDVYGVVFTPRTSTRLGIGGEGTASVDTDVIGLDVEYRRLDPEFRSLGMSQLQSDLRTVRVQPRARLFGRRLSLRGEYGNEANNLLGTRSATMTRSERALSAQGRLSTRFSVNMMGRQFSIENDPGSDVPNPVLVEQTQTLHLLSLAPTLTVQDDAQRTHAMSVSGSYNQLRDTSPAVERDLRPGAGYEAVSGTGSYGLTFPAGLTMNASITFTRNVAAVSETSSWASTLGVGYGLLDRTLQLNLTGSYAGNTITRFPVAGGISERLDVASNQFTTSFTASYQLSGADTFQFTARGLSSTSTSTGQDFDEFTATLRYRRTL